MYTKHTFVLTAIASAMMTAFTASAAEDESAVDLTPFISPESNISIGIGRFNGEREQFGVFDGVRDNESIILLDGEIRLRDNDSGAWTTAVFSNLGLDSEEARIGYDQQGNWGLDLHYNQIPRYAPFTINSGLIGVGSDSLTVAQPTISPGSGTDIEIGTQREILGVYFYKYLRPDLSLKVDFKNEDKNGTRQWGRGGQPEFMVEPIDWNTRQMEMSLNYSGKNYQMAGGYYGSWYTNANTLVDTIRDGDDPTVLNNHIYLSLPLDNQAHQLFFDAGYSFTPTMRGSFKASYTKATQDERMPTADIAGLADAAAPTHLDGEVNTTLLQLGLTARPLPELSLVANLRYHNVDDQTPAWLVVTGSTTVHSTPLSYETMSGKLEGIYRLPDGYSVIAGIDQKQQDRKVPFGGDTNPADGFDDERYVPFRTEMDETTYRLQLRRSLSDTLNGSISYLQSKRDGSVYDEAHHSMGGINPVNIADRERNKWRLTMDWMALDRLNLQFNFEDAQDDYGPESNQYGLLEGEAQMYSIDVDYSISKKWQLSAWYSHDNTEAQQFAGRWDRITEDHEADKFSELKDEGDSVGLGLRGRPSSKITVGTDIQWTRSQSQYLDTVTTDPTNAGNDPAYPADMQPLPDIENKMFRLSLFSEYALRKNTDIRVDLIHERWRTDDWSWQFNDGSPFIYGLDDASSNDADGTMVVQDYSQDSTFVGVRYIYTFR